MKILCAALIGLVVVASFAPPAAASLRDRLPEDAYGYMAVRDVPEFLEKVRASKLYQGLVKSGILQMVLAAPQFAEAREVWSTCVAPLGEVFRGEVAFAVLPAEPGDAEPRMLAVAEVDEAAYDAYFESAIQPLLGTAGVESEQLEAGGLSMLRITPNPEDEDDVLVLAMADGLFTMAESAETVAAFVRGPGRARLARTEGYTAFRAIAGQCDIEAYADVGRILDDVLGDEDSEGAAVVERLGLRRLRWAGWATWMRGDGSLSLFRVESASPPGGILRALRSTGAPRRSARLVPGDAHLYFAIDATSVADLYDGLVETIVAAGGMSREDVESDLGVDELGMALGFDLREKILPALGGELAIALKAPAKPFPPRLPAVAVFIEVTDRAVIERLMAELVEILTALAPEGTEPVRTRYEGTEVISLTVQPGIAPAYAFTDRFLVVGMSESVVKSILGTAPDESLAEAEAFRTVLEQVEGGAAVTVYGDYVGFAKAMMSSGAALAPEGAPPASVLSMLGVDDEVAMHFAWSLAVDGRGVTCRSYSELMPINPFSAIMAGMLLPALARARENARCAASMNNAREIVMAITCRAAEDDVLPERLSDLAREGYISDPEVFVHPANRAKAALIDFDKPETVDEYSDYELVLKGVDLNTLAGKDPSRIVLLREKRQFRKGGRVVVYLDGHAKFVLEEPEGEEE
jgi:hypothetical protein